jgi:MYXO-CTERM domain-containing protein
LVLVCAALVVALVPTHARAYSIHSEVGDACHEPITLDALADLRSAEGLAPWIEPTGEDKALVDDLPVDVKTDLAGATLMLAVRDVDLHGNEPDDLDQLAPLHGDVANQAEHCLRDTGDNEPDGSAKALARCRERILDRVQRALAGLRADGSVDPGKRTTFRAVLDIRGPVDAALPTFYVFMGHALHALQDGFSHQWRTSDHLRVVTVLNYVDVVNEPYDEVRDGPPHSTKLDQCTGLDAFRAARRATAQKASRELLSAALAPAADDNERLTRVGVVLDQYLTVEPGCSFDNAWCNAPEDQYRDEPGCGCRVGPGTTGWGVLLFALGGVLFVLRRSRGRWFALAFPLALVLTPGRASAQPATAEPTTPPDAVCPQGDEPVDVSPVTPTEKPFPLGGYVAGGGSLSNAAAAASLGARFRISSHMLVGADVEGNPWFSRSTKRFRAGTTNIYSSFIFRFPMDFERVNVRSTLQLGISRMNFDLYGVPKGTVGPYVGFSLVGLDFELSKSLYFVLDPAHIAIPIPQTSGVPFAYPQYRVTLGLQFGA